jgi:hypothetical protein
VPYPKPIERGIKLSTDIVNIRSTI